MKLEITNNEKTALLFGASGLIGGHVLNALVDSNAYVKIKVFVRTAIDFEHEKVSVHLIDFDQLMSYKKLIKGDDLFLCLGTTIKKAGSKKAFTRVDYLYPNLIAHIASEQKTNQILLVSSVGADKDSYFFYNRIKGKLEDAVLAMPFWASHIFRPSVLIGARKEKRIGESIAAKLGQRLEDVTGGILEKYSPIEAEVVAKAMVKAAQGLEPGPNFYPSHVIQKMVHSKQLR